MKWGLALSTDNVQKLRDDCLALVEEGLIMEVSGATPRYCVSSVSMF